MKELDFTSIVATVEEMLGPWLWVLVAVAALATIGFLAVLLRERGLRHRRLIWSEAAGLLGGVGAVAFLLVMTESNLADLGGPIDWIVAATIFLVGAGGATIGTYALAGTLAARRGHRAA